MNSLQFLPKELEDIIIDYKKSAEQHHENMITLFQKSIKYHKKISSDFNLSLNGDLHQKKRDKFYKNITKCCSFFIENNLFEQKFLELKTQSETFIKKYYNSMEQWKKNIIDFKMNHIKQYNHNMYCKIYNIKLLIEIIHINHCKYNN